MKIEQGDIVRITRGKVPFLVVSSDFYNSSGLIVVCPVVSSAVPDALHVPVSSGPFEGVVLCEELSTISAGNRGCARLGSISASELLEIIYRVQSIFDYFPHAE